MNNGIYDLGGEGESMGLVFIRYSCIILGRILLLLLLFYIFKMALLTRMGAYYPDR